MPKRTRNQEQPEVKEVNSEALPQAVEEALKNRLSKRSQQQYERYIKHMSAFFQEKVGVQ
jgi:hypothetical protein